MEWGVAKYAWFTAPCLHGAVYFRKAYILVYVLEDLVFPIRKYKKKKKKKKRKKRKKHNFWKKKKKKIKKKKKKKQSKEKFKNKKTK